MQLPYATKRLQAGYLLVLVLVFGSIFLIMVSSLVGFVISQNQVVNFRHEQQRATEIAEAGLNYYRWYLSHFPLDATVSTSSVYVDPEGGAIGEYDLSIVRNSYCGVTDSIDVTATAHTYVEPDAVSTISARYRQPTVAEFSFITDGETWYGSDRVITGPVHSNEGIRMDGFHNSAVGSAQPNWTCTSSFGCSPDQTVDGIYTTSGNATPGLFSFPISGVDFGGMAVDLNEMKDRSQNNGGIYVPPSSGWGYRVIFNGDGTVTIREVNGTYNYRAYSSSDGWHWGERNVITNDYFVRTETIDPDCPLVFVEDKVWLEGEVTQKVTLGASDLNPFGQVNIVLADNITYAPDTDAGLLAVAQNDVDVGLEVPYNMTANGIFIAKNGRFGRNHYWPGYLPWWLDGYVCRGSLTRFGSVISNGRVGTKWTGGNYCGSFSSGFQNRVTSFDQDQVDAPPPLTPETSDVYFLDDWRQEG